MTGKGKDFLLSVMQFREAGMDRLFGLLTN